MLNNDLVNAFNDCIDRLAAGQSLEECLRNYPQFAIDLEPMLLAGQLAVHARPTAIEVDVAKNRQRRRFEQALRTTPMPRSRPMTFSRVIGIAAAFVLIFGILLGGTAAYAQRSLPGDSLYGLKLLSEDGRLLAADILGDKNSLEAEFADRRIDETKDLLELGRQEAVEFEGVVASKQSTSDGYMVVVADLTITVTDATDGLPTFDGLQVGDQIQVEGQTTQDGNVIATLIRVINARSPELDRPDSITPTPIIGPSPTITPTERPTPTPTRSVDGINSQTPIPTREPTRAIDVPPTARPPTQVPPTDPPRDNSGDGGNDGGSDSDGSNDGGDGRR